MDAIKIFHARGRAFISQWVANPLVPVVVESREALSVVLRRNESNSRVEVTQLGRFGEGSVVTAKSHPVRSVDLDVTCWARTSYGNYAAAFAEFLRSMYELDARPKVTGYDVDHLLNRKRSQLAGLWVRLEACPAEVNQAWGRTFERHASDPGVYANTSRPRRTACYGIAAKMAGLNPPTSLTDGQAIDEIATYFRSIVPSDEPDPGPGVLSYLSRIYGRDKTVVVAVVDPLIPDAIRHGTVSTNDD